MLKDKMVIHVNGWNKDFGFNFDRKVLAKDNLNQALIDSICKHFERYGDFLEVNEVTLIKDSLFKIEYKIWSQVCFKKHWSYLGVVFHIIDVGGVGELNHGGNIVTVQENQTSFTSRR